MNKMLYALRRLQGESPAKASRATAPAERAAPVEREPTPRVPPRPSRPAFDVSAWTMPELGPEFDPPSPSAAPAVAPALPIAVVETPVPPKPTRGEAPWERAARADLVSENGAAYREIVARLRSDLPASLPRSVFLAGIGCLPEDTAAVALRIGLLNSAEQLTSLLIDAEAERRLTENLLSGHHPGLLESMVEGVPSRHFLIPTSADKLSLLPYGDGTKSLTVSAAHSFAAELDDLKTRANLIVVAGGGGETPLAASLARACDGCYLLVRLGVATSQQALAIRERLVSAGARLLGCIALSGDSAAPV